jgi:glycosyltransferase involved in cell wall biosynthesis
LKIIHIIPTLCKGGAERLVIDIVNEFSKRKDNAIRLVVLHNVVDYDISAIKELIDIIPASVQLSLWRKNKFQIDTLQQFLEDFQPDIIHTHLFEAELVSRFCEYPKARWFSHLHDNMIQLNNLSKSSLTKVKITNWYEKQVLFNRYKKNRGTHFIAISKHTETYIKSVQSKYPVTLLHNAINVKRFQKSTNPSLLTLNSQPLISTLTLINIGSFNSNKNQRFLLDIIIELNKLNQRVKCIFLGDGTLRKEVEQRSKKLNIYNQCQFLGIVDNVEEFLWESDVYVHTALSEALGLTLLEAMVAGLPVVTLDGGGNRDLMENDKNGFIINNQNPKIFAEKILEVKNNEEMKEYNIKFAQKFDIDNYTNKLLELYQSSISKEQRTTNKVQTKPS